MVSEDVPDGIIPKIVHAFLSSRLSILFIILALCLGAAAVLITPREEEPQIVVPMADVHVQAPGASAEEVEKLVTTPLERLLWQIDGVEYVYSISRRDEALVTVRFFVGEDRERSLVKLHNAITMHQDLVPSIVQGWLIKPVEIDDVPIVNLTLWSEIYGDHELRRIAEELFAHLSQLENISGITLTGGRSREIRVELLPDRMVGYHVTPLEVSRALKGADISVTAGSYHQRNRETLVRSDLFLDSALDVSNVVVGVFNGRPVYLRDVAHISDTPEEAAVYSRIGFSDRYLREQGLKSEEAVYPAVTLALAKKKGTNAVEVSRDIIEKVRTLEVQLLPHGVNVEVTRNYGKTAQDKVNNLLGSLIFAVLTVVGLLAFTLGWREALVVGMAVPLSFALALFMNNLFGYTINRVTMFALILSLGLVVDDPITNVDNIQRHILMGKKCYIDATLSAVSEVLPPVIMSTLAIIISFAPMFFITGMMGPYMEPMAVNVPLTVIFSTLAALTVVPWLSYKLLRRYGGRSKNVPNRIGRHYHAVVSPFLGSPKKTVALILAILLLLMGSILLAVFRQVPFKMLPFDNKNEFQVLIDLPEGTTLEGTDRVVKTFESYLRQVPEVKNYISFTGTASPMDFNGMVRHYYLRQGENLADIRVNLADKKRREFQSHAVVLRLRKDLEKIAEENDVNMKIVEVPPGPPVISTLTAESYGPPDLPYERLIMGGDAIAEIMQGEPFVMDIDTSAEDYREVVNFQLDKEKAALHNVSSEDVTKILRLSLSGESPANVHEEGERQPLPVRLILPRIARSSNAALSDIPLKSATGEIVQLAELGDFVPMAQEQPIYHKNLRRVVFVYGEMAGSSPVEAVLNIKRKLEKDPLPDNIEAEWAGEGEWKITVRVFRDLGIAYAASLMGIFILLVIQTRSFGMSGLIMTSIPLTILGIMPGFWLLNLAFTAPVDGFQNPIFFTATSMIGMIALGGIVIRNSLILIEFIQGATKKGLDLKEAILQSGAVRLRPILLTAGTTALGVWPILLDPIFSGLAWALIFGLFASTAFTLLLVPVAYYWLFRNRGVEDSRIQGFE
jgi:multidrug efflux pump subunit AcrB